ncbi:hypothetical protein GOP47_0017240 [Adiantum capillus-veneris]|uniref:Pentatricopeptide repeat-containing protein n=1 Tax=Adiantum capillus-veneris TaxID=13818 RepID=A0A9D4UJB1_ADICA|nr:hypothetical protein GOP47_0017240 [Adiantum capillus-veneris]
MSRATRIHHELRTSCKNKDLLAGTRLHNELLRRGLGEKDYSDALVSMYAKCGELQTAQALLDMHNSSSLIPWNALIAGYARKGKGQNALDCFECMQHNGILPDEVTYVCILKACAVIKAVGRGEKIHDEVSRQGLLDHNIVLGNTLVDMYAKCGALGKAQSVLEKLPTRNVVSWSALISGYAQNGCGQQALDCFGKMQREGILPDEVTYVSLLRACAMIEEIDKGKQIHDEISAQGWLKHHTVLGNALVDMYAKCGALCQAQSVLEELPSRDVFSWSALISGYAQNRQGQHALDCFGQMQREGILPNEVTYVSILKACAILGAINKGKQIHDEISAQGLLEQHVVLGNALVDMYAKCGALRQAQSVLEKLPSRDIVSWSALISGYAQQGQGQQALDCFGQMQHEGILANEVTYLYTLRACAMIGAVDKGKQIHDEISTQGLLENQVALGNALVDMYAKCGALHLAKSALEKLPFRNVISWSALISGYSQNMQGQQALDCFGEMQCEGILPDEVTYGCILKACAAIGAIDKGKQIHVEISTQGLLEHQVVLGNALVDMYAKCAAFCQAQSVLENLPSRNVVSWNALISGYAQNGQGQQALDCFKQMQCEGILPDVVTYVCILQACAAIGAINKGKQIHDEISMQGLLELNIVLGGALVDMYAKCGALQQAQNVLLKLPTRNVVHWNTLMAGYAQEGQGQHALDSFKQMQHDGILPDEVTFICLLSLCSQLGLVEKGRELFDSMYLIYGLKPNIESFTCMVDLLGRSGNLVNAVEVIQGMPFSTDNAIWHCLLGACRKWVDVNVGTWAFEQALELDKCDGAAYILMMEIYAGAGMLEKAKDIEAIYSKS